MSEPSANPGGEESQKVFFVSLGCPKNQVDSELMLGELTARKMLVVEDASDADVLVVNTCSFVEEAREESVDTILDLAHVATASDAFCCRLPRSRPDPPHSLSRCLVHSRSLMTIASLSRLVSQSDPVNH